MLLNQINQQSQICLVVGIQLIYNSIKHHLNSIDESFNPHYSLWETRHLQDLWFDNYSSNTTQYNNINPPDGRNYFNTNLNE